MRTLNRIRTHSKLRRLHWTQRLSGYRLRRQRDLAASDPFDVFGVPGEPDNPFERLYESRPNERLLIALHTRGLTHADAGARSVVARFAEAPADWGVRVFATGGDYSRAIPTLEIEPIPRTQGAQLRINWGDGEKSVGGMYHLGGVDMWAPQGLRAGVVSDAMEVVAAHEMGAHLVITADRRLLRERDGRPFEEVNLVTPREALVILGCWSRHAGAGGDFAYWHPFASIAYWAFARALTPRGWPAFGAWTYGERHLPQAKRLAALAQSVFVRLDFLARALDEMFVLWQRVPTNDTQDVLAARFDEVLMRVWAIDGSLARLVGYSTDVCPESDLQWSLSDRTFRRRLRTSEVGARVLKAAEHHRMAIRASLELRHHAVHRESLQTVRVADPRHAAEMMLRMPLEVASAVVQSLRSAGQTPDAWGMGPEIAPHKVHRVAHMGDGLSEEWDEWEDGARLLDPMMFAARLVAAVAGLADAVFAGLDPASDPRLPEQLASRARRPPSEGWAKPDRAAELLLSTPLSGLTPWVPAKVIEKAPAF